MFSTPYHVRHESNDDTVSDLTPGKQRPGFMTVPTTFHFYFFDVHRIMVRRSVAINVRKLNQSKTASGEERFSFGNNWCRRRRVVLELISRRNCRAHEIGGGVAAIIRRCCGIICDRHSRLNKSTVRAGQYTELDNLIWGRLSFVRLGTGSCYRKHLSDDTS